MKDLWMDGLLRLWQISCLRCPDDADLEQISPCPKNLFVDIMYCDFVTVQKKLF